MSYSFSARGATRADVLKNIAVEFDKVVASQPVHAEDRKQAEGAAAAFLGVILGSDDKDFYVSVSGSLSWDADQRLTSASVNVSASLIAKEKA